MFWPSTCADSTFGSYLTSPSPSVFGFFPPFIGCFGSCLGGAGCFLFPGAGEGGTIGFLSTALSLGFILLVTGLFKLWVEGALWSFY